MTSIRRSSPQFFSVSVVLSAAFILPALANAQDVGSLLTATAAYEPAAIERVFDGTVEAVHQATVSAQTGGRIAELNYDVDDYVEQGAVLVRFTDEEQQAALRQAEAQLAEAKARSIEADENHRRARDLHERGLGSQRDLDRALAARDSAVARVKASESAVASAKQRLEYTVVRAPYAGIVTQRHVELGETVTPGQRLMSGLSLERLRVAVDLPQSAAIEVRKAPVATVITSEGRVDSGEITMFPVADPVTNTFRVRLDLPEGQFGLYPGMFVKVAFAIGEAERLLVPAEAVLHRSEVTALYVVNDGKVRLRQVRTGQHFGDRVEILSGVLAGETVALDPVLAGIVAKREMGYSHD
ncbi:MAG: efflux RND transporter periplasmic adaptor subunit [Xanthomonadales bacterium]|nr:efflux RND transporter periplasmic adaptor subunit [Xanthomonadales bacterium]